MMLPSGQVFEVISEEDGKEKKQGVESQVSSEEMDLKRKEMIRISELRASGLSSVDAVKQARNELGLETSPGFMSLKKELDEYDSSPSSNSNSSSGGTGTSVLTKITNASISTELETVITSVAAVSSIAFVGYLLFQYLKK